MRILYSIKKDVGWYTYVRAHIHHNTKYFHLAFHIMVKY